MNTTIEKYWIELYVMAKDYGVTRHIIAIPDKTISVASLWERVQSEGLVDLQTQYALSSFGQRVKLNDYLHHSEQLECTQPLPVSPNQQRKRRLLRKKITA